MDKALTKTLTIFLFIISFTVFVDIQRKDQNDEALQALEEEITKCNELREEHSKSKQDYLEALKLMNVERDKFTKLSRECALSIITCERRVKNCYASGSR